jgi:hypothetical protein
MRWRDLQKICSAHETFRSLNGTTPYEVTLAAEHYDILKNALLFAESFNVTETGELQHAYSKPPKPPENN